MSARFKTGDRVKAIQTSYQMTANDVQLGETGTITHYSPLTDTYDIKIDGRLNQDIVSVTGTMIESMFKHYVAQLEPMPIPASLKKWFSEIKKATGL